MFQMIMRLMHFHNMLQGEQETTASVSDSNNVGTAGVPGAENTVLPITTPFFSCYAIASRVASMF